MAEHEVARTEARFELRGDLEEGERRRRADGLVALALVGVGSADDEHQSIALHPDEHVGVEVTCGAAKVIDVELLRRGADEHRDLAVAVPAERGDATRQLVVVLAGEDRVDDEGLESGIPEAARLGGAGVDVGGGERDLARVQQDRLAQRLVAVLHPILDDLDRDPDQLQGLLQAHRAQQLARSRAEHVGGDPRGRSGSSNQEMNDVMPACATRPTAERRLGGISPYHGSVSSRRLSVAVDSSPADACAARRASALSFWASSPPRCLLALAAGRSGGSRVHVVQAVLLDRLRRAATGRPRRGRRATSSVRTTIDGSVDLEEPACRRTRVGEPEVVGAERRERRRARTAGSGRARRA